MLVSGAVQKLERYGQLGLKRSDIFQFVQGSLKDEKQSNAFALTRSQTWMDCLSGLRRHDQCGVSSLGSPPVASEMLVFAAGFAVSLLQAPYNCELRGSQKIPACLAELTHSSTREVLTSIRQVISSLDSSNMASSTSVTEAYAMLLGSLATFVVASEVTDELVEELKRLLFVSCTKFRGSYAAFPVPSLLTVRTAGAIIKSHSSTKKSFSTLSMPLTLKLCLVESKFVSTGNPTDSALCDNLCRVCALGIANRATRLVVYFRGDDYKLAQSDVSNASDYAMHSFATTAPIDRSFSSCSIATEVMKTWLKSLPCLFKAFVSDAAWTSMAREQRRLKLQRDALRPQERSRKERSRGDALVREDDLDKLSAQGSALSVGSTIVSLMKKRESGSTDAELLSVLDTVDAETRSVLSAMSQASATSYLSFLSVIDAAGAEREEQQLHESADQNTNLALIFLEQLVLSISQLVESLPLEFLSSTRLVDVAWEQLERLFNIVLQSIAPTRSSQCEMPIEYRRAIITTETTPLFQFSHDMRYNGGLGYQTLGALFAKIMSPLLDTQEAVPLVPQARVNEVQWNQLRSAEQETALASCLGVYEAVAPQVINMHLKQIVDVVGSSLRQAQINNDSRNAERAAMLEHFMARIVSRLGKSNNAMSLLNILLDSIDTTSSMAAANALMILSREKIRNATSMCVEDCMDIEGILSFMSRLAGSFHSPTDDEAMSWPERISLGLQLMETVARGILPSSLTSSMIAEKVAELDLLTSGFLVDCASNSQPDVLLAGCRALLATRELMDRCMLDLGVANLEQYLTVLEESLWQFHTDLPSLVGTVSIEALEKLLRDVDGGVQTIARLALQRLKCCLSVTTILGTGASSRKDARKMAMFVIEHMGNQQHCSLLSLSLGEWSALSAYAKKSLTAAVVPALRYQCTIGALDVEKYCGEWATAAGDILDAMTVLLIETPSDSPALATLLKSLWVLVSGRAAIPRMPQVLEALATHLVRAVNSGDSGRCLNLLADLVALVLQANPRASKIIIGGAKSMDAGIRPCFSEYIEGQSEILAEEQESANALGTKFLCEEMALALTGHASRSVPCARLLQLLYQLAHSDSRGNTFRKSVVDHLQSQASQGIIESLASFLTLSPSQTCNFSRKRQRDSDETSIIGEFEPILSILRTRFFAEPRLSDAELFCLRTLLLQVRKTECLSPERAAHVLKLLRNSVLQSADGIIIAIALLNQDEDSTREVINYLENLFQEDNDKATLHIAIMDVLPRAVASLSMDNAAVSFLTHRLLRASTKMQRGETVPPTFSKGLACLLQLSRVPSLRFSMLKGHAKNAVETASSCIALRRTDVSLSDVQLLIQLLRLPLPQYHGDELFVDMEQNFLMLLPQYLTVLLTGPVSTSSSNTLKNVVKNVFHLFSSTFIDLNVFRHRFHLLAPLMSTWFTHVLQGLDSGAYDGSVTSAFTSFFFRLARSLHRSLDLSQRGGTQDSFKLGLETDALLLQQSSVVSTMFSLGAAHIGVFTRHAAELDFVAADIIKLIQRERLPDVFAHLAKRGEALRKNLSKNTYADLAFAAIRAEEGKNLLRQSILNAADGEQVLDSSILFSAQDRFFQ